MRVCVISFGPVSSRRNGYFIRVWNLIKALTDLNTDVELIEFPEYKSDYKLGSPVRCYRVSGNEKGRLSNLFRRILSFDPIHAVKFMIKSFIGLWKLRKVIKSADVVIVEGCLILSGIALSKLLGKKTVTDTHCINRILAERYRGNVLAYMLRILAWTLLETISLKLSDAVIVVSDVEREFVIRFYGLDEDRVFVAPNLVEIPRAGRWRGGGKVVLFVGDLEAVQNADAARFIVEEIAPWFLKVDKEVKFVIVGRSGGMKSDLPNVEIKGFVEDLAELFEIADVCIAPLRIGAGTKTKVLEYLAHGQVVLTTPKGIEGLESLGRFVRVTPIERFKFELLNLLSDPVVKDRRKVKRICTRLLDLEARRFRRGLVNAI